MFKVLFASVFVVSISSVLGSESEVKDANELNPANVACTVDISTQTASPQPVYLIPGTSNPFYPSDRNGRIQMSANQAMELWCSGSWTNFPGAPNLITANCVSGQTFRYANSNFNFNQFRCNQWPAWTTRRTSTSCFRNGILVDVGFQIGTRWVHVFTSCHDLTTEQNWYTIYNFTPVSDANQRNVERPRFINPPDFFPGRTVDNMYTRGAQTSTITTILGPNNFIQAEPSDVFLARGHIAAMTDFIYGWEQQATFNFINVAPQWQTFNGGNWVSVEISSRRLAADRNINLEVYTGTHGVTSLWTTANQFRQIFLDWRGSNAASRIPVPMIYYKILVHRASSSGVVLIGVNNFHLTLDQIFSRGYVVCNDVASQINYVSWSRTNLRRGYGYACTVADFLRVVPHVPGLSGITRLLT